MEIIKVLLLFIIAIEGSLLIYNKKEIEEEKANPRREITGKFKDPLGYRTNTRGQLRPVMPGGKILDGDEEDEV